MLYKERFLNLVFDDVLKSIDLTLDSSQLFSINTYAQMVIDYNKNVNITGSKDVSDFLMHHILDSLLAYKYFKYSQSILDVGTGSGLPSIPLAIVYKDKNFTLCESKNKKAEFLRLAQNKLALNNIKVECKNVYELKENFDTITARAFSELKTLIKIFNQLKTKDGVLLSYKGKLERIEAEIKEIGSSINKYKIETIPLKSSFLESERHILKVYSK